MATDQRSLPAFFNADADFRTWCQGIAAQLVVAGLVQTADTGQINNTTVVKPVSTDTASGYEIYRFNDTNQGSFPIFLKIEYGSGALATRPALWLTVGTGSNGSGTLTGQLSTRKEAGPNANKVAGNTLPSSIVGRSDGFALMCNYDSANTNFAIGFAVERSKDANANVGTSANDGIMVLVYGVAIGGQVSAQVVPYSGTVPASSVAGSMNVIGSSGNPVGGGNTSFAASVALMPMTAVLGKLLFGLVIAMFKLADITGGTQVTVNNLGANHNYLTFVTQIGDASSNTTAAGMALLWE